MRRRKKTDKMGDTPATKLCKTELKYVNAAASAGCTTYLVRAVHIVSSRDDDGKLKAAMVCLDEKLSGGLGRGVRVGGLEHVLFQHDLAAVGHALAVDLVRADMHKALDAVQLGGLEEHVRTENIVARKRERVAERVVYVSLRRKVQHRVYSLRLEHVVDQVGRADVAPDEPVVGRRRPSLNPSRAASCRGSSFHAGLREVAQAGAVVQLVQIHNGVPWIFLRQQDDDVAADEASAARDEDAARSVLPTHRNDPFNFFIMTILSKRG